MFGHGRLCHDCDFDIVKQIVIPIVICIVVITIFVINDIATYSNFGLGRCVWAANDLAQASRAPRQAGLARPDQICQPRCCIW